VIQKVFIDVLLFVIKNSLAVNIIALIFAIWDSANHASGSISNQFTVHATLQNLTLLSNVANQSHLVVDLVCRNYLVVTHAV
jgi:hypothetical protein